MSSFQRLASYHSGGSPPPQTLTSWGRGGQTHGGFGGGYFSAFNTMSNIANQLPPGTSSFFGGSVIHSSQMGPPAPTGGAVNLSAAAGIAGAAIFGVIGFLAASKQNKAIAEAAQLSMERVNLYITQFRVNALLAIEQIGLDAQKLLGNVTNAMGPRGIAKIESLMNDISDPAARNTWNSYEGLRRKELAAQHEKQNIAARGNAGMVNEWAKAIEAAGGGYQIGTEAYTAVQNAETARRLNAEYGEQYQLNLRGLRSALANGNIAFDTEEQIGAFSMLLSQLQTREQAMQAGVNRLNAFLVDERTKRWNTSHSSIGQGFKVNPGASSTPGTFSPSGNSPPWLLGLPISEE
jgi:hypothetical protein